MVVGEGDGYVDVPVTLSAPGQNVVTVELPRPRRHRRQSAGYGNPTTSPSPAPSPSPPARPPRPSASSSSDDANPEGLESFTARPQHPDQRDDRPRPMRGQHRRQRHRRRHAAACSSRDAIVDETAGTVNVPVILGGPAGEASNSTVTVDYTTSQRHRDRRLRLHRTTGTLTFAPGETVKNVPVDITNDTAAEAAERFAVTLTNPTNATIADGTGTVIIGANDATAVGAAAPSRSSDAVVGEGDGYVDVPVTLSAPGTERRHRRLPRPRRHRRRVGRLRQPDYITVSGTLTFAPGETTKTVRVEHHRRHQPRRPSRRSPFSLSTPTNATIARSTGTITIIDNDNGTNVFSYGIGNDTYTSPPAATTSSRTRSAGPTRSWRPVTYTLPTNVENLTLTGSPAINGTGNALEQPVHRQRRREQAQWARATTA